MKETGILFTGEEVRAILDGRKTQTRRVVKSPVSASQGKLPHNPMVKQNGSWYLPTEYSPYGKIGDTLWVRETWGYDPNDTVMETRDKSYIFYRADEDAFAHPWPWGWRPSTNMPRWASRIALEIVSVRVERVQSITRDDAISEGLYSFVSNLGARNSSPVRFYAPNSHDDGGYMNPIEAVESLWDSINSKRGYGWDVNPWVWVIEFEVVK
jgi:hypothetical protein